MTRELPGRPLRYAGGLRCVPKVVGANAWQAHLLKHPMGMRAQCVQHATGRRRWNDEGWDALDPPVVTLDERRRAVTEIRALRAADQRCAMPRLELEEYAGRAELERMPCYGCASALCSACARVLNEVVEVGPRYAKATERVLASLEGDLGHLLRRQELLELVMRLCRRRETLEDAAVLWCGLLPEEDRLVARVNAANGVRVECYLEYGSMSMRWRTTFRNVPGSGPKVAELLLDAPRRPSRGGALLSDCCVVSRPWWEKVQDARP
jgi:hypothetical protein